MEHLGLLEASQGGFRPGLQTQTSILKLTYDIEEARRRKGTFVVAMLDWTSTSFADVTREPGSQSALQVGKQRECKSLGDPLKAIPSAPPSSCSF
eukprot:2863151-Rhodomonas_salina.1